MIPIRQRQLQEDLAGIYYGYKNIPEHWLEVIIRREWIEDLCRMI